MDDDDTSSSGTPEMPEIEDGAGSAPSGVPVASPLAVAEVAAVGSEDTAAVRAEQTNDQQVKDPNTTMLRQDLNSGEAKINAPVIENIQNEREETHAVLNGDNIGGNVTSYAARMKQAEQDAKEDAEVYEDMVRDQRRHEEEWERRMHTVGDMEMSGADLEKLMNFIRSPAGKAKIESALKSKGMDQKQIDKAQREAEEFARLKEEEKKRDLTPDEQHRLNEINKSTEFKVYMQEAAEVAHNNGIVISCNRSLNTQAAQVTVKEDAKYETRNAVYDEKNNSKEKMAEKSSAFSDITSQALANERFANAPKLTSNFSASAAVQPSAVALPSVANDAGITTTQIAANVTQIKIRQAAADTSFG